MSLTSASTTQRVYRYLRHQLLAGVYPPGTRLRYGPIGAEIGASATPVREAANRLASEGFLEIIPNLGAVVRSPDRREVEELYVYRGVLESAAVRIACGRMTSSQIEACGSYVDQLRELAYAFRDSGKPSMPKDLLEPFMEADVAFHTLIVDAAGNRFLTKSLDDLSIITRIFFAKAREGHPLRFVALAYSHHRRILQAIRQRDAELAVTLMRQHINIGCAIAMQNFERLERQARMERSRVLISSVNGISSLEPSPNTKYKPNAANHSGMLRQNVTP